MHLISAAAVLRKEKIFRSLIEQAKNENYSRIKIYEALLQTYLFAGFPSALNSLKILNDIYPRKAKAVVNKNLNELNKAGIRNCKKIYGNKYLKLIKNVSGFSPELSKWLISEGYGKVLSRKGLSLSERELSIISVLTVLKFDDQLYSHINGAVKLKISLQKIKNLINDLRIFDSTYSVFGNKVLTLYLNNKNKNPSQNSLKENSSV